MRSLVMVVGVLGALAGRAHADQCQLVDFDVADWATKLLAKGVSFVSQCEPCGDKAPSQPTTVNRVSAHSTKADPQLKQVVLNGQDIDLAYVFVQTGRFTYTNAALMLGCPTQSVSASVTVRPQLARKVSARIPSSCHDYEREINKLQKCDKIPQQARDAIKQGFDQMTQTFDGVDAMPADQLKGLDDACKAGTDAIRQSMSGLGC